MKSAVIQFPASNCDRDAQVALEQMTGRKVPLVWHQDSELPDVDLTPAGPANTSARNSTPPTRSSATRTAAPRARGQIPAVPNGLRGWNSGR